MADECTSGSGWIWGISIVIIIILIFLLWLWAWPSGCSSCSSSRAGGNGQAKQVETFDVTVAEKDETHPNYGRGCEFGFVINGIQGKSLTLKSGNQYRFIIRTEGYSFYLSTSEKGCDEGFSVEGTPTEMGSFPFIPTDNMPQPLYYCCKENDYMGGSVLIE